MPFNPDIHHRRSIRLPGYDYTSAGAYFVTICAKERQCLFGVIEKGQMRLNDAGLMIEQWFAELENKFPAIEGDAFICMPNHVHCIVVNVGADLCVRPKSPPLQDGIRQMPSDNLAGQTRRSAPTEPSLSQVVQWFKTMTTNEYIRGVKQKGWPAFAGTLWQRNFYERIIRDEAELSGVREYIRSNPALWATDELHMPLAGST